MDSTFLPDCCSHWVLVFVRAGKPDAEGWYWIHLLFSGRLQKCSLTYLKFKGPRSPDASHLVQPRLSASQRHWNQHRHRRSSRWSLRSTLWAVTQAMLVGTHFLWSNARSQPIAMWLVLCAGNGQAWHTFYSSKAYIEGEEVPCACLWDPAP